MGLCFSKKKKAPPSPTPALSSHPPASQPIPRHQKKDPTEEATTPRVSQEQAQVGGGKQTKGEGKDQPGGLAEQVTAAATAATDVDPKTKPAIAAASVKQQTAHRNEVPTTEENPQAAAAVRTSSCTKEEVESILIQCGRLSRNSSGSEARHRRSRKRSYDFDCGERNADEEVEEEREKPQFSRPSPHRHRRTPSSERDCNELKRSGSRERGSGSGGGGRRVSRSPGRRSDAPVASSSSNASSVDKSRQTPGKMVSVPAREKTSAPTAEAGGGASVRNAAPLSATADGGPKRGGSEGGGMRSASPRSRSPANASRSCNENLLPSQQPQSLSRSSSRKAEHSPYRRNPMVEVDGNIVLKAEPQPLPKPNQLVQQDNNKVQSSRKFENEGIRRPPHQSQQLQKSTGDDTTQMRRHDVRSGGATQVATSAANSNSTANRSVRGQVMSSGVKEQAAAAEEVADVNLVQKGGGEVVLSLPCLGAGDHVLNNPRAITRNTSSRRSSRDLDAANSGFNPDAHLINGNPAPSSYTSLLLEDIHNYHQQSTTAAFPLPACVSKACFILEAVANLNSHSASNSKTSDHADCSRAENGCHQGAKASKTLPPTQTTQSVESMVAVQQQQPRDDELANPSCCLHKYVTTRDVGGGDLEEPQESAGSNSFVGQPWACSPWEPGSVDSTDHCWTSLPWSGSNGGGGGGGVAQENTEEKGEGEEFMTCGSPPRDKSHKHHRRQRSGGGVEASGGRRSRNHGVSTTTSTNASNNSKRGTESAARHHRTPSAGRVVVAVGGNAKVGRA